jgi:hypothetical protein
LVAADGRFVPDVLLTVQQAAVLCGRAEMTVRRRLRKNALPGARLVDHAGTARWFIPVAALAHAGLRPAEHVGEPDSVPDAGQPQGHLQHLADENLLLRKTVLALRRDLEFLQSLLNTGGAA